MDASFNAKTNSECRALTVLEPSLTAGGEDIWCQKDHTLTAHNATKASNGRRAGLRRTAANGGDTNAERKKTPGGGGICMV